MMHVVQSSKLLFWDQCCTRSEFPTFTFRTDVTCSPNVLASSLGMMEHAVCVFSVYPGGIVKPNPYIAIYSVLELSTNLRVGVLFGLN